MLVGSGVEAFVFAGEVVSPVGVEVSVVDEDSEREDGFGPVKSPAPAVT